MIITLLDMGTVKYFINSKAEFLTPLVWALIYVIGAGKPHIEQIGWQDVQFEKLGNFVRRTLSIFQDTSSLIHNEKTLWASWIIEGQDDNRLFQRSGYDTHYKECW